MLPIADWVDIFCGHSGAVGGCNWLNKIQKNVPNIFFPNFFSPQATPGPSAIIQLNMKHCKCTV